MKNILKVILIILIGGLVWFLFIKEYDYQFQFTASYGKGSVFREIYTWDALNFGDNPNVKLKEAKPFTSITQEVNPVNYNDIVLHWELENKNDSTVNIKVSSKITENRLAERIAILNPWSSESYIDKLKPSLLVFKKELEGKQSSYRISHQPETVSPELECICTNSKVAIDKKANAMIGTMGKLEEYFKANNLKMQGHPVLKVNSWDPEQEIIDFDFCYPVKDLEGLIATATIELKRFKPQQSLLAIYNGNYKSSQLAWFELNDLAESKDLQSSNKPLEVFYNNPMNGGEAEQWKTEVFMPVIPNR